MGSHLRGLIGALKDTASLSKAAASVTVPSPAANFAVIRATTHSPSAEPPHPRHIDALLAFGYGSRLSAAALATALAARLLSTRDASVALKSLLALHQLLSRGAFILRDQLNAALLRRPSSGRNPLALASFPHGSSPSSWALAAWVRWYARLIELLLLAVADENISLCSGRHRPLGKAEADEDRLTSLLNREIISELDALVGIVEEICRSPETAAAVVGNKLIAEVMRLAEEDRFIAEHEILNRVKEMTHRLGSLKFSDSVELVCLLRRFNECRFRPVGRVPTMDDCCWTVINDLSDRVEPLVLQKDEEERKKVRREKASVSARIEPNRASMVSDRAHEFGSTRWELIVDARKEKISEQRERLMGSNRTGGG